MAVISFCENKPVSNRNQWEGEPLYRLWLVDRAKTLNPIWHATTENILSKKLLNVICYQNEWTNESYYQFKWHTNVKKLSTFVCCTIWTDHTVETKTIKFTNFAQFAKCTNTLNLGLPNGVCMLIQFSVQSHSHPRETTVTTTTTESNQCQSNQFVFVALFTLLFFFARSLSRSTTNRRSTNIHTKPPQ